MQKEKNIIFPSDTKELISKTLKDFGLEETDAEMYEKIVSGQKSINVTAAYLVKKIATGYMGLNEAIGIFACDLNIPPEKAERVLKALNAIVVPMGKPQLPTKELEGETPPQIKKIINDNYKEPID